MTRKVLTAAVCVIGLVAFQQAPAMAQGKPPMTGDAKDITKTSALLSGTFYGGSDFASMGWGLAPKKGMANCGPLKTTGAQSCVAKSLSCGTTYYFTATNGKQTGDWKPFTTLPCN
jgi:hypothetical protein